MHHHRHIAERRVPRSGNTACEGTKEDEDDLPVEGRRSFPHVVDSSCVSGRTVVVRRFSLHRHRSDSGQRYFLAAAVVALRTTTPVSMQHDSVLSRRWEIKPPKHRCPPKVMCAG